MTRLNIRAGTSGWSNQEWVPEFYPSALKAGNRLAFYATHLPAVEVNTSFYRPLTPAMVARWHATVPDHFCFAVKAWKRITHELKLRHCETELVQFMDMLAGFGEKLGPVLFQCPPKLAYDSSVLASFLALLPAGRRYCFEFRHASWFNDETMSLLAQHGVASCESHLREWTSPAHGAGAFRYIRLHGSTDWFKGSYSDDFLKPLARDILASGQDAYIYFNNTMGSPQAVHNARRLLQLCMMDHDDGR